MSEDDLRQHKILLYVRGEESADILGEAGIGVKVSRRRVVVNNPSSLVVTITPGDVARGLLSHRNNTGELSRWATIVLGGSSFISLSGEFEQDANGHAMLEALWEASFDGEVTPESVSIAESLVTA